jgi:O-antigen ligase
MISNPFTGVGPGAFLRAFPDFSERPSLQAHNTYIQFGAEFGPIALFAILILLLLSIASLWKVKPRGLFDPTVKRDPDLFVREAVLAAIVGVTVTGFFLSQQLFELMYFLLFMANVLVLNCRERISLSESNNNEECEAPKERLMNGVVIVPARRS